MSSKPLHIVQWCREGDRAGLFFDVVEMSETEAVTVRKYLHSLWQAKVIQDYYVQSMVGQETLTGVRSVINSIDKTLCLKSRGINVAKPKLPDNEPELTEDDGPEIKKPASPIPDDETYF